MEVKIAGAPETVRIAAALVTFPDSETDCRRSWPPQAAGGEGGECTVRVSPESHASGALTIGAAIQRVKQSGGTVCLAAGEYPLSDPVEIHDARSVRLRGQGLATVLVATGAARAIDVRRALAVTIENLSVVASSAERASDAIRLERCLDATLRRTLTALVASLAAQRAIPSVLVTHQLTDAQHGSPLCGRPGAPHLERTAAAVPVYVACARKVTTELAPGPNR